MGRSPARERAESVAVAFVVEVMDVATVVVVAVRLARSVERVEDESSHQERGWWWKGRKK